MNPSDYQVRRATLDDIGALKALWEFMRYPAAELERRLTEFQVIEGPSGEVVGALGFQIVDRQARIHGEAFKDFAIADSLRPLFWKRMQSLAMNHGVVRLWTQERAPYWSRNGFQPVNTAIAEKLPPTWDRSASDWLVLQLKEDAAIQALSPDAEFAAYMKAEREKTAAQVRAAKKFGKTVGLLFALVVIALLIYAFVRNPGLLQRILPR